MDNLKKVLVGLDLTEYDGNLIAYTKYFNLLARPEKLIFTHIQKQLEIPDEIIKLFPNLKEDVDKELIKDMVDEAKGFNIVGTDIEYKVGKGEPLTEMLNNAQQLQADLIIVGRKPSLKNSNLTPKKLARKASSHVLFVPQNAPDKIKKIQIAVDFSDYSKIALEDAILLADKADAEIICQHVYEVPMGYHKTGKTYEEFANIMKGHAQKEFDIFISKLDTKDVKITPVFTLNNQSKVSELITDYAKANKVDLIIIGARGRTDVAAVFLGSVAENLIETDMNIPLLIIKKKDKTYGLWDVLKNL